MLDPATFFLDQAETSFQIQFMYDLAAQRVVFVNRAYEQVLGGNPAHVNDELPALLARLHSEDLPLWQRYWDLWKQNRLHDEVELRLRTPDGSDQWLCLTPHWYQDAEGNTWLGGTLRDITLSKDNQEVNEKFNTKKNTVLEILAHDLSGAFGIMQRLAEYVQEEVREQGNAQVVEMLGMMQTTSQKSIQMIKDLLEQEFLESSSIRLNRERVDLREKVQQCLEPFQRAPGSEARQLEVVVPEEPVYAEVDVNKVLQVVDNLVGNALKFTPDENPIRVSVMPCPNCVQITIADEGIGIPEALQPVLFERFTKARRIGLRGEPTTGLGLSLCKTIVELHHGTLSVTSTEGKGTVFTIELPVARGE